MGRKKEVRYRNGILVGKYLEEKDCQRLDAIRAASEGNVEIADLRHAIFHLSEDEIDWVIGNRQALEEKPKGVLKPVQTTGVAFLYFAKRAILGDSVGMGKTAQVGGLLNLLRGEAEAQGSDFKVLFLTEKTLSTQARRELVKFTGEFVDLLPNAEKARVEKYVRNAWDEGVTSLVGTHALLNQSAFFDFLFEWKEVVGVFPFDLLVVDESSVLGNTKTARYKSAQIVVDEFDRVVLLNATPFESALSVFYAQLHFLDKTLLPTKTEFEQRFVVMDYSGMYPRPSGKFKNGKEFKKMVGYRYLSRARKDVGATMRDCSAKVLVSRLTPKQKRLLSRSSMPQMVYDVPGYLDKEIPFNRVQVPKLDSLLGLLEGELRYRDSVLVYSHFKEAQKELKRSLENEGYSCEVLNGDSDLNERNRVIEGFKNNEFKVLITNVQKGMNFGSCNVCVFYSYDSNPNRMVQFEGRTTRTFDIVDKHSYILCSEGRELDRLKEVVSDRARASEEFAGSDFSCVLGLLTSEELEMV